MAVGPLAILLPFLLQPVQKDECCFKEDNTNVKPVFISLESNKREIKSDMCDEELDEMRGYFLAIE